MQQELSKYLADLLHQHDRLCVPSLGTFELSHAPALVDQVQGQVNAPSKSVRFNPNLVMDDGVLVEYIQQRLGWSLVQTQRWLQGQVEEIKAGLDRREIIELPGVGRFFRNFENKLQFVAENANFNLESFGLQAVSGKLVARSPEEKIPAIQKKVSHTPPSPKTTPKSFDVLAWLRENYIWALAGFLLLVLLSVIILYPRTPTPEAPVYQDGITDVPQERLNASPSKPQDEGEDATAAPPQDADEQGNASAPSNNQDSDRQTPVTDTEAPTLSPEEHSAVIAVGLFGNPENVARLLERLSKEGYAPISRPEGDNTRVGVSIRYTDEAELQRTLREIKRKYTSSAFILSRDGREVSRR